MTHRTRRASLMRPLAVLAALALLLGLAGTALADPDFATVTGYAPATSENNHPDTWGDNCADADGASNVDSWVLPVRAPASSTAWSW